MATKGERQALLFIAAVALLGVGVRVVRSRPTANDSSGLEKQIEAVEAAGAGKVRRPPKRPPRKKAARGDTSVGVLRVAPVARGPVDMDVADAPAIERLPAIGPAIAGRIVADRNAHGAFGCLKALDGVKGIGPSLLARLDTLVVFSGTKRPECFTAGAGFQEPRPGPEG